ncbi:MAG: hypothetical protein H0U57_12945 [Tatlockia sp.]|nr:hypothetical protein [Tatlockia sp.]
MHIIQYLVSIHQSLNEAEGAIKSGHYQFAKDLNAKAYSLIEQRNSYADYLYDHWDYARLMSSAMIKYSDQIVYLHFSDAQELIAYYESYLSNGDISNAYNAFNAMNTKINQIKEIFLNATRNGIEKTSPYINIPHNLNQLALNCGTLVVYYYNQEQKRLITHTSKTQFFGKDKTSTLLHQNIANALNFSEGLQTLGLHRQQKQNRQETENKPYKLFNLSIFKSEPLQQTQFESDSLSKKGFRL